MRPGREALQGAGERAGRPPVEQCAACGAQPRGDKAKADGVVFCLMSFFIEIGVVIILDAATGTMWDERGMSWSAAVSTMQRAS